MLDIFHLKLFQLLDGPECPDLWSEMNGKRGFGGRASMLNLPLYEAPACGLGGLLAFQCIQSSLG